MKTCSKCGETKKLEDYWKEKRAKDGRASACRSCCSRSKKQYYKKNKETIKEKAKQYYDQNQEKVKAYNKSEEGKARHKRYRETENGKEAKRQQNHRRRAIKKEATTQHFSYEDLRIFWLGQNILDDRCYYCSKTLPDGPEHIDHYIPLAKGGTHEPVNLRPSCAPCNLSKSDKLPT